jgi:DNA polymerase I
VTKFLLKVLEQHQPDYLGVVFDAGTSERHEIFPEYKATREKMPTSWRRRSRGPRDRRGFNVPVLELDGYEADDVIGTLAAQAAAGSRR